MWCRAIGFIVTLTLSMLALPLAAVAQPAGKVPKIGFLHHSSVNSQLEARNLEAFQQGLRELGYIEGQNIAMAQRYVESRPERLPVLAAELATLPVDVFVVSVNPPAPPRAGGRGDPIAGRRGTRVGQTEGTPLCW